MPARVISMRIVSWLAFRAELDDALRTDDAFCERINASLAEQYVHLSQHLEKDLLANHYLENLKALAILACYFGDRKTLELALPMLKAQVNEQVLDDGMHFELSPMYQKIVLEDLMRAAIVLRDSGFGEHAEAFKLQQMCDCLYSMERGIDRTVALRSRAFRRCTGISWCAKEFRLLHSRTADQGGLRQGDFRCRQAGPGLCHGARSLRRIEFRVLCGWRAVDCELRHLCLSGCEKA